MKAKKKLLWLAVAATLAVCAVVGAVIVSAAETSTGKDGVFNGSPAHVDENGNLYIDEINFPDEEFRSNVQAKFDTDKDNYLTKEEALNVTNIYAYDYTSLSGVEFFINLKVLDCGENYCEELTEINVTANTALTELDVSQCRIKKLDVTHNKALKKLLCDSCGLSELDVSQNTLLTKLNCANNSIAKLDFSKNTLLEELDCGYNNKIKELDLSNNTLLKSLHISYSTLDKIDLHPLPYLERLSCEGNNLTELDVSKNTALIELWCGGYKPKLTKVDVSKNIFLEVLHCENVQLDSLDLSNNKKLRDLWCDGCGLKALDLSNNTELDFLWCYNNELDELNLSANTKIGHIVCHTNHLTTLDLTSCSTALTQSHSGNPVDASKQTYNKKFIVEKTDEGRYSYNLASILADSKKYVTKVEAVVGEEKNLLTYSTDTGIAESDKLADSVIYTISIPGAKVTMDVTLTNIVDKDEKVPETTVPPETTAPKPAETTAAPVETTKAPVETTRTPETTKTPETTPEVTPAETTAPSEPPVLEDKDESVTVEFPASEASAYSDVELTVERNADDAKKAADSAFAGKYESYVPYEISLTKSGEAFAPVSSLTVNVPVPEGWDASKTAVYYVAAGSQPVDMNASASANGKYVTFTTTHFSTYVLVNIATAMPETTAPVETTAAPAETTAAPAETTAAPTETTAAPTETTAAPAVTTAAPSSGSTAKPPETGDGTVNGVAAIVAAMCTCAAGAVVAYGVRKKK